MFACVYACMCVLCVRIYTTAERDKNKNYWLIKQLSNNLIARSTDHFFLIISTFWSVNFLIVADYHQ